MMMRLEGSQIAALQCLEMLLLFQRFDGSPSCGEFVLF